MSAKRCLGAVACLFLIGLLTVSCSLPRRQLIDMPPYDKTVSVPAIKNLRVIFDEVIPGKPLNETVWDNASGPFWDVEESKQIGFTQDYTSFIPVAATAGLIGGAIGGAVAGAAAGPDLVKTKIFIPFGNVFSRTFQAAMPKNMNDYSICFNSICASRQSPNGNELRITVEKFFVWEGPLNHLNLYVKGKSQFKGDGTEAQGYAFEKAMVSQKLGSMMSTHSSFLKEMNRLTHLFAAELTTEIIEKAIK